MVDIKAEGAKPIDMEAIKFLLDDIATLMNGLRKHAVEHIDEDGGLVVQVMAEKAGWLADKAIGMFGSAAVCGDFEAWTTYKQEQPPQPAARCSGL